MVRCPSVCLTIPFAATACSGFAAVDPVGRRYRLTAARPALQQHGTQHQVWALPRFLHMRVGEHRLVSIVSVREFSPT